MGGRRGALEREMNGKGGEKNGNVEEQGHGSWEEKELGFQHPCSVPPTPALSAILVPAGILEV